MSDTPNDAKSIFLAAVELGDAAERAAFVERSCGDDAVLRKRVDDLLRAYGQPDGPLDKLAAAMASTEISEPIREQVGATIGPYKLMEQIGEGGFGLVFVAEQQQPIRRKVALKIIRPGMDTRDVIARFEAERQALALMDHPNIARVLDAGTTESGRPYFVMELVRGIPITDYCDQSQLTPRERLTLFVDVCNAVQHAHTKGIIHRDVKPSNVLVTLHDDRPVVKVIDFGVAKALHQPLTEKTIYTRFAQMIGTPLYMSPEQAQMSGLDIDTRSDIYSLGVLLYELLTGTTPLDKQRLAKAAYDEMLKIIREEEPPKPSVRLNQSTTLPSIAALRKTEPSKLPKMFDGDVDWIAMKALEKDRTRRYETANAFAADVLRYLNDEPVEASPPSTMYRLQKFARKNRTQVLVIVLIAALLVIGIAGTTVGLFDARRAEQEALAAESAARAAEHEALQQREEAETARNRAREAEIREGNQRKTAEEERDRAERQLIDGLLRPVGFSSEKREDSGELRSFVDWSAIRESSLKMRVLEVAFENPETALRLARRAERAIQACVGISPNRRALAVKLLSSRQRDSEADPRIRIAASWLALELGATDLPAWREGCDYLSDRKNRFVGDSFPQHDLLAEYAKFAADRSSPLQNSTLDWNYLISTMETSPGDADLVGYILTRAAARFEPSRIERFLLSALRKTPPSQVVPSDLVVALGSVARRLEPPQVNRIAREFLPYVWGSVDEPLTQVAMRLDQSDVMPFLDALVEASIHARNGRYFAHQATFGVLAARLRPAEIKVASRLFVTAIKRPATIGFDGIAAIAPRMAVEEVNQSLEVIIANLPKFADEGGQALASLAPRLEPPQAARAWDAIVDTLRQRGMPTGRWAALAALAPRLDLPKVKHAGDALITSIEKPGVPRNLNDLTAYGLAVLAPKLEAAQAARAWTALVANWDEQFHFFSPVGDPRSAALEALAKRLEPSAVDRAAKASLITASRSASFCCLGLPALVDRLPPAKVEAAWNAAMAVVTATDHTPYNGDTGLRRIAVRLQPEQVASAAEVFIANLERPRDGIAFVAACNGVIALAPLMRGDQVARASGPLINLPSEPSPAFDYHSLAIDCFVALSPRFGSNDLKQCWFSLMHFPSKDAALAYRGLGALAPYVGTPLREECVADAVASFLDYAASLSEGSDAMTPDIGERLIDATTPLTLQISSPKTLAKLLSHPGCVADQRQRFLARFEELVFYDGKPVFLKPEAADGKKAAADRQPGGMGGLELGTRADGGPLAAPRRFHSLHDAAAWIRQNWPDFDLETNCPVTWRGSR